MLPDQQEWTTTKSRFLPKSRLYLEHLVEENWGKGRREKRQREGEQVRERKAKEEVREREREAQAAAAFLGWRGSDADWLIPFAGAREFRDRPGNQGSVMQKYKPQGLWPTRGSNKGSVYLQAVGDQHHLTRARFGGLLTVMDDDI